MENIDRFSLKNNMIKSPNTNRLSMLFNNYYFKIFGYFPFFLYNIKKDKPDLIHAHFGPSGYNFLNIKLKTKIPMITRFYGEDLSLYPNQYPKWKRQYQDLFQKCEKFIVEGLHMKETLINLGCDKNKISVHHLGINLNEIKYIPRKISDKNKEIKLLISASFREKKGIPYAIEACGHIVNNNPNLNIKLTVIGDSRGKPEEEKTKQEIFEIIKKYDIEDKITFMGYQPYNIYLNELYNHHIFIHPSIHASNGDSEGGAPVSIIEASASGMPVLSTTHCDIPEVIINGKSGYLVSERSVSALIDKLNQLIFESDSWEEIGVYGRKHIEKEFNIEKQINKLENEYDRLIDMYPSC
jgi:colanic acid/amylovoran biosynthesis glycosyltransferase